MSIPNFMKIRRGPDFFWLIWHGMTRMSNFNSVVIVRYQLNCLFVYVVLVMIPSNKDNKKCSEHCHK